MITLHETIDFFSKYMCKLISLIFQNDYNNSISFTLDLMNSHLMFRQFCY
jgi:hypothetical protein